MDAEGSLEFVRDTLNRQKTKLWLPPYVTSDGTISLEEIKKLAKDLTPMVNYPESVVIECLLTLQQKSIDNMKERNTFQSTGIATLKIRCMSKHDKPLNINIKLSANGKELKESVSKILNEAPDRLKIIGKGKVVLDDAPLQNQGVKHGMQLLALLICASVNDLKEFETNDAFVNSTKEDVNLLTGSFSSEGENYLQIADQTGKPINLPAEEKKALVLAITLHEKGRAEMKKENFSLALYFLLEAEAEFSRCNSQLLENVDNYGLLNLDVAWCYLCLQSINQLPDAEVRLHKCAEVFHKSYGPNLERLMAVKGSTESEEALFLRLHLLQGIVYYHQNKIDLAQSTLSKVENQLKSLKIDDVQLSQLLNLGYNLGESRIALRESKGNVNIAVSIIENKRAEHKKHEEAAKKEREYNKERKKLGKCADGSWVEPEYHKALMTMGYSSSTAKWALAQSNNKISDAVSLIQEHPELLPAAAPVPLNEQSIKQLSALGWSLEVAEAALKKHNGNFNNALDELVTTGGIIMLEDDSSLEGEKDEKKSSEAGGSEPGPSTSKNTSSASKKKRTSAKEQEEAYSRVAEGLANLSEDYLDLALQTEEQFLEKYKKLISMHINKS